MNEFLLFLYASLVVTNIIRFLSFLGLQVVDYLTICSTPYRYVTL